MSIARTIGVLAAATTAASAAHAQVGNGVIVPSGEDAVAIYVYGVERVRVDQEGEVGIGTSDPTFALELGGDAAFSSRSIGVDGTPALFLPDQADFGGSIAVGNGLQSSVHLGGQDGQGNTAVGINALLNSTVETYQTAVGTNALMDSGGYGNTAVGYGVMVTNESGFDNTGVGALALTNLTHGIDNVAVGIKSMQSFISGSENVAIGGDSLMFLLSGERNTALGTMAGRFLADGVTPKTAGDGSIYIGYQAWGSTVDDAQNEIVIGSYATGAGSNTVTLGNDLIEKTLLKGKIGVGEANPDYDFVFKGNGFQVSDDTASTRLLFYTQSSINRAVIKANTGKSLAFLVNGGAIEAARFDSSGNFGLGTTTFGTSAKGVLGIGAGIAPTSTPPNMIQLWADSTSGSSELRVMDAAGNVTTLSPHNFSLIANGPSEELAWSYYAQRDGMAINVDMLRLVRVVENLSGEHLVYIAPVADAIAAPRPDSSADLAVQPPSAAAPVAGVGGTGEVQIATGAASLSVGPAASSVALGADASAAFHNSTALGVGAETTEANQVAIGGAGSAVRVGDIASSTAAQVGEVAVATVDNRGVVGRNTAIMPSLRTLEAVSSAHAAQLMELQAGQQALAGQVDRLFDLREEDTRDMRRGVAAAVAIGNAPMPSAPGRTTYVLNGSTFRGEQAVGGSIMHRLGGSNPLAIGAGFSSAGGKNTAVRVGVAGEF